MLYNVYAIRDRFVGFTQPTIDLNDDVAKRNFAYAINNNQMLNFSPSDYDLYHIATFDSDTGRYDSVDIPELVVTGVSVFNAKVGD